MEPYLRGSMWPPGTRSSLSFGGTAHRAELLAGLLDALHDLQRAGCRLAYLDGSFVTDKDAPGDYDLCWDMDTST